jgi:hypothetical protein
MPGTAGAPVTAGTLAEAGKPSVGTLTTHDFLRKVTKKLLKQLKIHEISHSASTSLELNS